ncbi:MAG: response regulator [Candidatus Abyssobacteria bacterium SURF_5]|uniref:Response regulator n=1 Tax=Abyssobacteria bacterium (strain SURF_5) TaxID=2093360 RepID=A0A3A4N8X7_ABYX5|nr:MAG: response regulator [Candidatus Abyssubacteria bacterium SURF_5]
MTILRTETGKIADILLVEDNPGDIRLTQEAFREGKIKINLHITRDGEEAMDFLRQNGKFEDAPRPDLILLDLNLPRKDGREVLEELKRDQDLKNIPVVILTVSKAEEDVLKTYNLNANAYIVKPVDLDQFIRVIRVIEDFWLTIVTLPKKGQD